MASAQGNSNSSDPTDINHVLESLGSLIGELDACVTEVQDEQVSSKATILDKINGTSGPPLPPISMMPKWRVFAPLRLHHCFGGKGG